MPLSLQATDRIFERLVAAYGRQFLDLYADVSPAGVKTAWSHELADFSEPAGLKRIAAVLANLPERAPTAPQFRGLCRQVHIPEAPPLPPPAANPELVRQELAKLGHLDKPVRMGTPSTIDPQAWVDRVLARHAAGEKLSPYTLNCATEVKRRRAGVR